METLEWIFVLIGAGMCTIIVASFFFCVAEVIAIFDKEYMK